MIKVMIQSDFIDKNTKEYYKQGEIREFEDTRAKELLNDNRGLVKIVEVEVEPQVEDKPKAKKTKKS